MTGWAERKADADREWRMERATAERVPCPWCAASVGESCVSKYTGQVLRKAPAHWQRVKAAVERPDWTGEASQAAAEETQG